jgi:hypothetical protein
VIAQSRWPRGVMWRSSGAENGTELDAPARPKKGANVYFVRVLRLRRWRSGNALKGFLVAAADRQRRARTIVMTLPAEVKALRPRAQLPGSGGPPEAARCARNP